MAFNRDIYPGDYGAPMRWNRAFQIWNDNEFTWDDIFDASEMLDHFTIYEKFLASGQQTTSQSVC